MLRHLKIHSLRQQLLKFGGTVITRSKFDRNKNYQVERNAQEKELGLIKYKLKEYEKYRDEGPDADIIIPPQFSSINEYVEALLESGQVLEEAPLNYTGELLNALDEGDSINETVIQQLSTFEKLGEFEYPPNCKILKEKSVDIYSKFMNVSTYNTEKISDLSSYEEFITKLKEDDPGKIIKYITNIYHYHPSNFEWCCNSIIGYNLHDSLLTLKWFNDPIQDTFKNAYEGCIVKAKLCGMDFNKTYVADCKVISGAIVQDLYRQYFIKGRGRAGSTNDPITAHLRVILQEREIPFSSINSDGLEHIRKRFRTRSLPITQTPEEVCQEYFKKYPRKKLFSGDN